MRREARGERRHGFAAALCCAAALLSFSLPGHAQLFGGGDEAARKEQAKRIDELKAQNEALSARLARVEEALKGGGADSTLELAQQLERLRQEMTQLRGQIEVLGNDIQGAAKRQRDMYVDLDTRLRRIEQPGAASEAPAAAAASAVPAAPAAPAVAAPAVAAAPAAAARTAARTSAPAPAATSEAEARAYEAAQAQRRNGNYPGAIAGFRNFIAQYPKSPLAHRAQYWIGDSYYNLREFKNAIASQQRLIAAYPESTTVADALLNIASSQIELGENAVARKTLEKLIQRYPASEAADKGRRRLAAIEKERTGSR